MMLNPAVMLHKQIYIQSNYSAAGVGFLSRKSIPLTNNTKLVISVYQEQQNNSVVVDHNGWDVPPQNTAVYSVHVWEAQGGEYTKFHGWHHLDFKTYMTSYSRHFMTHLILRDTLKEEDDRYTHYDVQVDIVIFEPMSQIGLSRIELL